MTPRIWGKRRRDHTVHKVCHPTNDLRHQDYYSLPNRKPTHHLTRLQCQKHSLHPYLCLMVSPKNSNFSRTYSETTKKMYPHLTEIQKINYFHSLLQGNALQAYCNLDDAKKNNLEEVITAFKRRFGDFQLSAKARCEWDSLHFDPTKQKLHEFLDTLAKNS